MTEQRVTSVQEFTTIRPLDYTEGLGNGSGLRTGRRALAGDTIFGMLAGSAAVVVLLMMFSLLFVLGRSAVPSVREFGFKFLVTSTWRPNVLSQPIELIGPDGKAVLNEEGEPRYQRGADGKFLKRELAPVFGALPVIYGTAMSSALALIFAVPLSLGAALFLIRISPKWLSGPVSFLIEFLAAIPSIAYGIWGIFVLQPVLLTRVEPWVNRIAASTPGLGWIHFEPASGRDMLCAGLILAIMVIPIITAVSRDVLRAVPRVQIEGSLALGATWWQSSFEMLRFSRSGLFGAVILGLARAAGETMAVTMVIGNSMEIHASPLAPSQTMASLLANQFGNPENSMHTSALLEVALILLVMSLLFNMLARWLVVGSSTGPSATTSALRSFPPFRVIGMLAERAGALVGRATALLPAKPVSRVAYSACIAFAAIIIALLAVVTGYLISIGWSSVSLSFFTQSFVAEGLPGYPGGMLHGLVGTGILILLASAIGIPIGALCGIYLSEYSANSWLGAPVRFVCDVLTGVPSIVVGILGYELVVVPLGNHFSGWAGAIALGFIMVPIVARTTEEMLRLVPNSYREASIALGSTKARTILRVIVPSATSGLVTGVMLAMARVAGETAPLLFTALGAHVLTVNPNQAFPSLTKQIFDYATQSGPNAPETKLAWAGILVLISLIFVLNVGIRITARPRHAAA